MEYFNLQAKNGFNTGIVSFIVYRVSEVYPVISSSIIVKTSFSSTFVVFWLFRSLSRLLKTSSQVSSQCSYILLYMTLTFQGVRDTVLLIESLAVTRSLLEDIFDTTHVSFWCRLVPEIAGGCDISTHSSSIRWIARSMFLAFNCKFNNSCRIFSRVSVFMIICSSLLNLSVNSSMLVQLLATKVASRQFNNVPKKLKRQKDINKIPCKLGI